MSVSIDTRISVDNKQIPLRVFGNTWLEVDCDLDLIDVYINKLNYNNSMRLISYRDCITKELFGIRVSDDQEMITTDKNTILIKKASDIKPDDYLMSFKDGITRFFYVVSTLQLYDIEDHAYNIYSSDDYNHAIVNEIMIPVHNF